MADFSKALFGRDDIGPIGIIVAGSSSTSFIRDVLKLFDSILFTGDGVFHPHLVRQGVQNVPLLFNIYGAAAMIDAISVLREGGCRTVIFVGKAYGGFHNLRVGEVVLPDKCYHFDGIYHPMNLSRDIAHPNKDLTKRIHARLQSVGICVHKGPNISVPAVTLQPVHENEEYLRIRPMTLEMELAACLSHSLDLGVRACGVLVISDNRTSALSDPKRKKKCLDKMIRIIKECVKNLQDLKLSPLDNVDSYSIKSYLASVIHNPKDIQNIYDSD